MKLFNPFRWHICSFKQGGYALRKLSIFWYGWKYRDCDDSSTWTRKEHVKKYCLFASFGDAWETLQPVKEDRGTYANP